jgi:uncharacterized protein YeeX (DUF496 family)
MKMNIKKTDSLMEFLRYKRELKKQLALMTEAQYVENPVGFEVYGYIDKMLEHYNDREMNYIVKNQDALMRAFGV